MILVRLMIVMKYFARHMIQEMIQGAELKLAPRPHQGSRSSWSVEAGAELSTMNENRNDAKPLPGPRLLCWLELHHSIQFQNKKNICGVWTPDTPDFWKYASCHHRYCKHRWYHLFVFENACSLFTKLTFLGSLRHWYAKHGARHLPHLLGSPSRNWLEKSPTKEPGSISGFEKLPQKLYKNTSPSTVARIYLSISTFRFKWGFTFPHTLSSCKQWKHHSKRRNCLWKGICQIKGAKTIRKSSLQLG